MRKKFRQIGLNSVLAGILLLLNTVPLIARCTADIWVDQNGQGDFETVTEAIQSLPVFNYERTTIFLKKGVYTEKIRIDCDYITLSGESRAETIIRYAQLRLDWEKDKDAIGPAVVNIHADDVILENVTIENTQPEIGPHAFVIYGTGTRTIIQHCNVHSRGGDTIALWNYKEGKYYLADCSISGAVDFVCPRGWCFMCDCQLYEHKPTAALWHAGGYCRDQKFVIVNSKFDGVSGFKLGRHHYEAQFYLVNCQFSEALSDVPIYYVFYPDAPERNRPFNWGARYHFYNCQRQGGDYDWFADNLQEADGSPEAADLTAAWTFAGDWDPESPAGPVVRNYTIQGNRVIFQFSEIVSVSGCPKLHTATGISLIYHSGGGSDTIRFDSATPLKREDLKAPLQISNGQLTGTVAAVKPRPVDFRLKI
ncbi:MAG: pectinesterase family protein [Fidelibacterota bacterium]